MIKMQNETKELFKAPWKTYPLDDVGDVNGYYVCSCETTEMANRIMHLPELYDALKEALEYICGVPWDDDCTNCEAKSLGCRVREWHDLLIKVRDGK